MDIGDILAHLSEEDMENLRQTAAALFEGAEAGGETESGGKTESGGETESGGKTESGGETESGGKAGAAGMPDLSSLLGNAELLGKIGTVMSAMNRRDPRSDLIAALKPLLTEKRRKKADEAAQIIKLMDIMPLLGKPGGMG